MRQFGNRSLFGIIFYFGESLRIELALKGLACVQISVLRREGYGTLGHLARKDVLIGRRSPSISILYLQWGRRRQDEAALSRTVTPSLPRRKDCKGRDWPDRFPAVGRESGEKTSALLS
jgi:hypothetical protein